MNKNDRYSSSSILRKCDIQMKQNMYVTINVRNENTRMHDEVREKIWKRQNKVQIVILRGTLIYHLNRSLNLMLSDSELLN